MLKITESNVSRISEDVLFNVLNNLDESDPQFKIIDAELNRRAELSRTQALKTKELKMRHLVLVQSISNEIHVIFEGFNGPKTLMLIEKLGQDFIDNYTIDPETFTVHSHVACLSYNGEVNNRWEFETMEEANRKKAKLIYDRIYDRYMRDATVDNLEYLRRTLEAA